MLNMLDKMKNFETLVKTQLHRLTANKQAFREFELYYFTLKLHDDVKRVLYETEALPKEFRQKMEFVSQYERLQELLFEIKKELNELS